MAAIYFRAGEVVADTVSLPKKYCAATAAPLT